MGEQQDTVKEAKRRLCQYIHLQFELYRQCERLARLKSAEKFPTRPEGNEGGTGQPNPHRQENAIVRRMEYENKMNARVAEITAELDAIDDAIDSLPDALEREVLRLRYTDGENNRHIEWSEVALNLYGDNDEKHLLATYRLHGRALVNIATIFNEVKEDGKL